MKLLFFKFNSKYQIKSNLKICCFLVFSTTSLFAQTNPSDSLDHHLVDEVLVQAIRVKKNAPVSFSNISIKEIENRNLGQDIPLLLNFMPSVVTTSDAGNGMGYTGIRVRGSDASRVNVTINGIPYNDSESQGTFWVNMPDFASSTQSFQLQRGVGTSTNGSGAFGASLNLSTDAISRNANAEINNSVGSFNSRKHTLKFSTGLFNENFEISGRLSSLHSDGYIDRAQSDLGSYFFQTSYLKDKTLLKFLVFGGNQKSYQAWNGVDKETLLKDRTYNPSGAYMDDLGAMAFYKNETDNYKQTHYQLHWNQFWNARWNSSFAIHYTKGKGFYENYKLDQTLSDYNISNQIINDELIESSDLIRQKWLDNHFYGFTYSLKYQSEKMEWINGGAYNIYEGDHFGRVLWLRNAVLPNHEHQYYFDHSRKTDFNFFSKLNYNLVDDLTWYVDLQYRKVSYSANALETGLVKDQFNFLNPKTGITYQFNEKNNFYFSYAKANREPNRNDYENGNPIPEKLDDYELGWRLHKEKFMLNLNVYYMDYKDQLVLTGSLNDVGYPVRENIGNSYRMGVELETATKILKSLNWNFNITMSQNKNKDFNFVRDGEIVNLGKTNIAYSPEIIAANAFVYKPFRNFKVEFLSKYVGEQYMGNIDSEKSKLSSYFTNDLGFSYEWFPSKIFQSISIHGLINNMFDVKYESNGYFYTYDDDWSVAGKIKTIEESGYFPQAGTNFMLGLNLKF